MKIAEEQKTQFIVLCCLIVFVFAFAVYKVVGSSSHAQTRQTQAVAKKADQNKAPENNPDAREALAVAAASDAAGDTAARDPFIPQVGADAKSSTLSQPVRASLPPPVFRSGGMTALKPLMPPMSFDRQITVTTNNNTPAGQTEQEPDPSQILKLTGVIQGAVNIAILRGPDNARYIVHEGQIIDGKYRVDLVTRFGVRLSFNHKSFLLSLGGSDASKGAR